MQTNHVGFFPPNDKKGILRNYDGLKMKRYFISFSHKVLPTGKIEFQNCIIELAGFENFDVRNIEKDIREASNLQDVSIIAFQKLTEGEK